LRRLGRKRAADEPFRCSGDFQASVAGDARGVNDFGLPGEPLRRAPSPAYRTEGPFAPWHFSEDASLGRFRPHLAATNRTASTAGWPGLYLSCERRLAIGHVEVSTLDREPRDWHQYSSGVLGSISFGITLLIVWGVCVVLGLGAVALRNGKWRARRSIPIASPRYWRLIAAWVGPKRSAQRSLSMLLQASDLPGDGSGVDETAHVPGRRDGRGDRAWSEGKTAGKRHGAAAVAQSERSRWLSIEVVPLATATDATEAVKDITFVGYPNPQAKIIAERLVDGPTVPGCSTTWGIRRRPLFGVQERGSTRRPGLSRRRRGLSGASSSVSQPLPSGRSGRGRRSSPSPR
jgi:hypothetical protein